MRAADGDTQGAMEAYNRALQINVAVGVQDPSHTGSRRAVAISSKYVATPASMQSFFVNTLSKAMRLDSASQPV